jgi:hypothetical protein
MKAFDIKFYINPFFGSAAGTCGQTKGQIVRQTVRLHVIYTELFLSPSGISDPCGTIAGMVTTKGEHVNRGRDTPSFCPTLQVLDMCSLGDAADVNPVPIKFLRHALQRVSQELDSENRDCTVIYLVRLPLILNTRMK